MIRVSNYQDLLKVIALTCMIIDHIGLYFLPETWILRAIGRYAFPIFCLSYSQKWCMKKIR
ncbi:MAG: conjugal transfer protein TraX [Rickettsiaceae bacterium]|nr:conjugal transfer protein TraX [Rickettsiaceae bacterium]